MTEQKTEVKFGPEQLSNPTPKWAKIVFGIFIVFTTAIALWVAGTGLISEAAKVEWVLILKCSDVAILGLSKLFGVETQEKPPINFMGNKQ